jgi:hypothetical protein
MTCVLRCRWFHFYISKQDVRKILNGKNNHFIVKHAIHFRCYEMHYSYRSDDRRLLTSCIRISDLGNGCFLIQDKNRNLHRSRTSLPGIVEELKETYHLTPIECKSAFTTRRSKSGASDKALGLPPCGRRRSLSTSVVTKSALLYEEDSTKVSAKMESGHATCLSSNSIQGSKNGALYALLQGGKWSLLHFRLSDQLLQAFPTSDSTAILKSFVLTFHSEISFVGKV